jgi:hypothetical protein
MSSIVPETDGVTEHVAEELLVALYRRVGAGACARGALVPALVHAFSVNAGIGCRR